LLAKLGADESRLRFRSAAEREFAYIINVGATLAHERLTLEVAQRDKKINGEWGKLKTKKLALYEIGELEDPKDRRILAILFGSRPGTAYGYSPYYGESVYPEFMVPEPLWDILLAPMCATGRCLLRTSIMAKEYPVLHWDDGDAWKLCLKVTRENHGANYVVNGVLRRGATEMELAKPVLLLAGGLVFWDHWVARLDDHGVFGWISLLRAQGSLSIPKEEGDSFIAELLRALPVNVEQNVAPGGERIHHRLNGRSIVIVEHLGPFEQFALVLLEQAARQRGLAGARGR
jgi:hypothetical protein